MDLPEWLVFPFLSGAVGLFVSKNLYSYELKNNESEAALISIWVGIPASMLVLYLRNFWSISVPDENTENFGNLIFCVITTVILVATFFYIKNKVKEGSLHPAPSRPMFGLEKNIFDIQKLNKDATFLIELKNGLIYAGFILRYDSDSLENEKIITILPFKSGKRQDTGFVRYLHFYRKNSREINVYLREIVSVREYDSNINSAFGHS